MLSLSKERDKLEDQCKVLRANKQRAKESFEKSMAELKEAISTHAPTAVRHLKRRRASAH